MLGTNPSIASLSVEALVPITLCSVVRVLLELDEISLVSEVPKLPEIIELVIDVVSSEE